MDAVKGHSYDITAQQDAACQFPVCRQSRSRIHDTTVNQNRAESTKDTQCAPGPHQKSLAEQNARQKSDDTHGKHLPWCQGALPEHDVGSQHRHGSHQKAGFPSKGHACDDGHRHHRLELGQHEKECPARHANGAQHRDDDQLPCLWLPAFKDQEKGKHGLQQDQEGDKIILLPTQIGDPHKERHRNEQQDQNRCHQCAFGQLPLFLWWLPQIVWPVAAACNTHGKHDQGNAKNQV